MIETNLTGQSKDIVSENIKILKELFPDIVVEDKIDFDKFKSNFGEFIDDSHEKYNFTWPGKTQAIRESQKQSTGTLRPCPEESKNWESTQNLYIEGDNLEVLKLLQKGYYNKIKCIYIDPPYNTGKDFIYSDNYQDNLENYLKISGQVVGLEDSTLSLSQKNGIKITSSGIRGFYPLSLSQKNGIKITSNPETSGRYHSNWLNMMYPRLKLARNLLRKDGIIFISIDDNEVDNLKKLCNEIFGEENFIAQLPTIMNLKGNNDQFGFSGTHEYTLVFGKFKDCINDLNGLSLDDEEIKKYNLIDEKGYYKQGATLMRTGEAGARKFRPKGYYPIYVNKQCTELNIERQSEEDYEIFPKTKNGKEMSWRRSKENLMKTKDEFIIKKNNGKISFYKKQRLNVDMVKGKKPKTLFYKPEYNSGNGTLLVSELFGDRVFDNPKPIELIKDFIKIGSNENDIILDFFSGSSTTAHAVFEINNEFNSKRRFIMIQIPEEVNKNSIAYEKGFRTLSDISKERIRRSGDKILKESGNNEMDIGFKVFKLDSSNLKKWDSDYNNIQQSLTIDNIKEDRSNEDLVYEIMLKYGIDLTLPIEEHNNIYSIGFGALVICLDNNITKEIANDIVKLTEKSSTSRVVFKDSGFKSDADKTNIKEILKINNIDEFITI